MADFPQRRPYYTIDLGQSQFLGKSYDCKNSQYTFTVEQGCRFYLQLNLTASPFPTRADLFKNGQIVESTRMGTIFVGIDRMGIQSVDRKAYEGTYTIRSSNDAGSGEISFQLKVQHYFQQAKRYSVDIANSVYTSHNIINGIHVFDVEQGQRFFLKLNDSVGSGVPDLYKNGQKLMSSPSGTINVRSNSVGIESTMARDDGTYKIQSSNGAELTYRLNVTATDAYRQRRNEYTRTGDPW